MKAKPYIPSGSLLITIAACVMSIILLSDTARAQYRTNVVSVTVPSYSAPTSQHSTPTWITALLVNAPAMAGAVRTKAVLSGNVDDCYMIGGHQYQWSPGPKNTAFSDDITSALSSYEGIFYVSLYDWYVGAGNYAAFNGACEFTFVTPAETLLPDENICKTIDPINTMSGAMYFDEADLALPCPAIPLEFQRRYNSLLTDTNSLGVGWTHSFDWKVMATNTSPAGWSISWRVLKANDGHTYWFRMDSGGVNGYCADNNWRVVVADNKTSLVIPGGLFYSFETNGLLTGISNLWGRTLSCEYTNIASAQCLSRVWHDNGQSLKFTYSGNRLSQVQAATNLYAAFLFDSNGRLTNSTVVSSGKSASTRYAYDVCMTQRVNAAGDKYSYAYQGDRKASSLVVNTNIFKHSVAYNSGNTVVTYYRGQNTNSTTYQFSSGRLVGIDGADRQSEWLIYDVYGNLTQHWFTEVINGMPQLWSQFQYDGNHCLTSAEAAVNTDSPNHWTYTWDPASILPVSGTDPEGCKIGFEYTNGSPSRIKFYRDGVNSFDTTFSYSTNGLLCAVTNANKHWQSFEYDEQGYLSRIKPQAGPEIVLSNNVLGIAEKITMPGNAGARVVAMESDTLGRVSKVTWPDQQAETFARDVTGNVTNYTDRAGRVTRYDYLPLSKLYAATKTWGTTTLTTRVNYDNQFNVLGYIDEKGRAAESYKLDLRDRIIAVTNTEGQVMTANYWLEQLPAGITRYDGTVVTNLYDSDALLSETRFPDNTNRYAYLKNKKICAITNAISTVGLSMDLLGRTVQTVSTFGGFSPKTVQYGYYPAGQISNVVTVAGAVQYRFDVAERLTNMATRFSAWGFAYNPNNGLMNSMICTNTGITTTRMFDDMDRLTNLVWSAPGGAVLRSFGYKHNAVGMITNVTFSDGSVVNYDYDSLDQLISESRSLSGGVAQVISYGYDSVGNRTNKTRDGISVNYTYSNGCNRLVEWTSGTTNNYLTLQQLDMRGQSSESIGTNPVYGQLWVSNLTAATPAVAGTSFALNGMAVSLGTQSIVMAIGDVAGNVRLATNSFVVAVTTNTALSYNLAGCITNIHGTGAGDVWDLNLTWDSQYQLIMAGTNGVAVERHGYGPLGERLWTWTPQSGTNWHIYAGAHVVADLDASGSIVRSYEYGLAIDDILSMTTYGATTNTYYYLKDHLGSVYALVNSSGQVVESYRYDAWGRVLEVYDQNNMPMLESAIGNRYLWQGREYSFKTGLYYFRARFYDPVTGRFISKDPSGIVNGLNEYVALNNNPVNFIDPTGEAAIEAYDYWSGVAVSGQDAGGAMGNLQTAGASVMMSFIDFWGTRSLENNASLSGQYSASEGCKGNAWKHGFFAGGQIALSAASAFGGNNAVHPWIRYVGPKSLGTFDSAGRVLSGTWVTRAPAFGRNFARAADALQLPNMPNDVIRVQGAWKQFIRSEGRATGYPQFGSGGAPQWRVH